MSDDLRSKANAEGHAEMVARQTAEDYARFHAQYVAPLMSFSDAARPLPRMNWVVDSIGADGHVVGLFGAPGSGKTYVLMDMAVCIAMAKPWLGRSTQSRRILWIDEDIGRNTTLRRMGEVQRGHNAPLDLPINMLSLAGVNITTPQGLNDLSRLVGMHKTNENTGPVVFIDTLSDVCAGVKIVSPDDLIGPLRALRTIAEHHNSLVCFIHHANKQGQYLGATTISGKADLLMGVAKRSGSDSIVEFTTTKARHVTPMSFAARLNRTEILKIDPLDGSEIDATTFRMETSQTKRLDAADKIAALKGTPRHIVEELRRRRTASVTDLVDDLNKIDAVRKSLQRLKDDGIVEQRTPGVYALKDDSQDGDE
jgi:hypothetical protein